MKRFAKALFLLMMASILAHGQGFQSVEAGLQELVDQGLAPGFVTLVAQKGQVIHQAQIGWQDREAQTPMQAETLFRLHSMTKPITSVAVLMLVEEGKLGLDDPLAKHLPVFEGLRVYDESVPEDGLEPERPVTIRDLLTHSGGITSGSFDPSPVGEQYREALGARDITSLGEFMQVLASLPLAHQPGENWTYGYSTDVLAAVVEQVSGVSFRDFLKARILEPLRMKDTDYFVPPAKLDRLATLYVHTKDETAAVPHERDKIEAYTEMPHLFQGTTGLISTASDFARFAQMLLNGGELDSVRLLRPETVALMTRNHLSESALPLTVGPFEFPGPGFGFGLGVGVVQDPSATLFAGALSEGSYWWVGSADTWFWVDPQQELVGILMTQVADVNVHPFFPRFQSLVYQALKDEASQ